MTWRKIAISWRVASSICDDDTSPLSAPKSMILAANSRPVSLQMHLRTVELIPLFEKKKKNQDLINVLSINGILFDLTAVILVE